MDSSLLFGLGFALVVVGVLVVIAAVLIGSRGGKDGGVKSAGVIMIGPIPIIFGNDKKMLKSVMILAIVLMAVAIVAMLIYYFVLR